MEVTVFSGEYGDSDALKKEHALGLFVSTGEHRILFDFGNKTALKNLRALDLSAAEADLAVLSHGHSGAGGGLKELAPALRGIRIYSRESAFDAHYFKKSRLSYKTVSLPKKLPREGFSFVKSFLKIDDELSIISNFKPTKQVLAEPRYFVDGDRFFEPDTFSHELALIVSDEDSLTLFVGGAHAGLMQIIERAEKTFSKQVGKVVGALELTDKKGKPLYSEERTRNFAFELEKFTRAEFYFASGIGDSVFGVLQEELGERIRRLHVGETRRI